MGINVSHISSTGTLTLGTTSLGNTISVGSTGMLTDHYLSDKEIKDKFSTTASHRRKFKVNEIFRHGVYILFMGNVVVYVGESINPYARVCAHIKSEKNLMGLKLYIAKKVEEDTGKKN